MTVDLTKIIESKATLRRALAKLPVAEKLLMLEGLRERLLAIRPQTSRTGPAEPGSVTQPGVNVDSGAPVGQ